MNVALHTVSICSGIAGLDVAIRRTAASDANADLFRCVSDFAEIVLRNNVSMRQPVTVGAKDYSVLNRESTAFGLWVDVMSVAWCLFPCASHALVHEQTTHGFVPRRLISIVELGRKYVGSAFVPRNSLSTFARFSMSGSFAAFARGSLMVEKIFSLVSFFVPVWQMSSAATRTRNHQSRNLMNCHSLIISKTVRIGDR